MHACPQLYRDSVLIQEIPTRLRQYLIIVPLERQPAFFRCAHSPIRFLSLFIRNDILRQSVCAAGCGVDEELRLARFVEGEEPECCLVDGLPDGEDAVVLEYGGFSGA